MKINRLLWAIIGCAIITTGFSAGVNDTYDELQTTDGITYKSCTVTKVEPDGLTVMHSEGAGKIPFAKLPADIQQKYNFNPAAAETYASEQAAKRKAQIQANLAALDQSYDQRQKMQAKEKELQKKREQMLAGKAALVGYVLSKTKEGVLVQCDVRMAEGDSLASIGGGGNVNLPTPSGLDAPEVYGLFFLRNHPSQSTLVDKDSISIVAYPDGTYTYKSAIGAVNTVKCYTAKLP